MFDIDSKAHVTLTPTVSFPRADIKSSDSQLLQNEILETKEMFAHDSMPPSTISVTDTTCHHEYPEGGLKAYLTVIGAFLALFSSFGHISSFGTYEAWYAEHQLHQLSSSTISWIGSLQLWVFFFSVRVGCTTFLYRI